MSEHWRVVTALTIALTLVIGCGGMEPTAPPVPQTGTPVPLVATPVPAATPTYTPTTPAPAATAPTNLPETVLLEPMNYRQQTANNCGPASIAIVLGYYGHRVTQQEVNEHVPAGSSSCQVAGYMPQHQLMARIYASPPSLEPVRQLLANRIPVIANQKLTSDMNVRHFRVIKGYNDASRTFISDDPLQGSGLRIGYDTFTGLSDPGILIPVYPPEMDPLVQSLMGPLGMHERDCQ